MDGAGDMPEMPVLIPEVQFSPDIAVAPEIPRPQFQFRISEAQCERAVFIWELHENTFPLPVIPPKAIINPLDPERDSSVSIVDVMERVPSGRFIRGQEINKPAEWQLYLQNDTEADDSGEKDLQLVVTCEKIYIQSSVHVLAKVACEIIDDEGVAIWSSGDVYNSEVKPFVQGTRHVFSLGSKTYLQERHSEFVKNGILRFRVRLNIYKDLSQQQQNRANENEVHPAKRRRVENGVFSGLTDLLDSLESLWKNREQSGDITILCGEQEIKAHRFLLSGRSKVFLEMLNSKMNSKEQSSSVIKVNDIAPEVITAMLEFLYLSTTSQFDWTNIDHVCALIYAADKYWITPLMTRCYQNLMKIMNLDNFAKIAKVAFMYNCEKQFKDEVRHFFESNQITLNDVDSFRRFAYEDFDYFHKLFFYVS